jgi:hypothetical protein
MIKPFNIKILLDKNEVAKMSECAEFDHQGFFSTLPKDMIEKISSYFEDHSIDKHVCSRINRHWKMSMEQIYAKRLSCIHHIHPTRCPRLGICLPDTNTDIPDECTPDKLASRYNLMFSLYGFDTINGKKCSLNNKSKSVSKLLERFHRAFIPTSRMSHFGITALIGAVIQNEIVSASRLFKLLLSDTADFVQFSRSIVSFVEFVLSCTLCASDVHMFDTLYKIACPVEHLFSEHTRFFQLLIRTCPFDADPSILIRLLRFAKEVGTHAFMFKNTLGDLDHEYLRDFHYQLAPVEYSQFFGMFAMHPQLLKDPVSKILFDKIGYYHSYNYGTLLQGGQQCFDLLAKQLPSDFWTNAFNCKATVDHMPFSIQHLDSPYAYVERILRNNVAAEQKTIRGQSSSNIPIMIVPTNRLYPLLTDSRATASLIEILCDRMIVTNHNESYEPFCMENLIPRILGDFRKPNVLPNQSGVRLLIAKLKIIIAKFAQSRMNTTVVCRSDIFFKLAKNRSDWDLQQLNGCHLADFLTLCVEQLNIHFVPVCQSEKDMPLTCLISSPSAMFRLWTRWAHDLKHADHQPSKSCLNIMIQCYIAWRDKVMLKMIIQHDFVSELLLLDEKTLMMKEELWEQCLLSVDQPLCQLFDHLPKPQMTGNAHKFPSVDPLTISCYEYGLYSHDLKWIDYVSKWSAPTPGKSLQHWVRYLKGLSTNPLPDDVIASLTPSHELIIHLMDHLSKLESPCTVIAYNDTLDILKRLSFVTNDDFHSFWQKMWQSLGIKSFNLTQ